ncbi:MAG: type II toxin-antitoxin system RelE/ParE family toxin [Bacteroidota bacterium]
MLGYKLSPEADLDLEEIFLYTIQTFGLSQAEKYLGEIKAAFSSIIDAPTAAINRKMIVAEQEIYARRVGSHRIFYRPRRTGIEIVRVLHTAQDIEQNLNLEK